MGSFMSTDNTYKDVSDLTNYYTKTNSDNKYALKSQIPTGNFVTYADANKNSFNMSADYITVNNKTGQNISKLDKTGTITVNNNNQVSTILKNTNQTQTFGIQNGNDSYGDFIRLGSVTLDTNGSISKQTPFIRFNMKPTDTDGSSLLTYVRSNIIANKDVSFGDDNIYYTLSRGDLKTDKCVTLKFTDQSNTDTTKNYKDKQVLKWCPSNL